MRHVPSVTLAQLAAHHLEDAASLTLRPVRGEYQKLPNDVVRQREGVTE